MLILKVNPKKPDAAALKKAAAVLKSGGLVVYPTETAYALGCDPTDPKAVKRLFSVKKRDASKPLPLIAASSAMAGRFLDLDRYTRILAENFWPGSLTLVLPVKKPFSRFFAPAQKRGKLIGSRQRTIALRVSPHPIAVVLSKALGRPVVSTSANRSGGASPYDVASVLRGLGTLPDLVLDAGALRPSPVSTFVRVRDGVCEILREGAISEDDLHRALMKSL